MAWCVCVVADSGQQVIADANTLRALIASGVVKLTDAQGRPIEIVSFKLFSILKRSSLYFIERD